MEMKESMKEYLEEDFTNEEIQEIDKVLQDLDVKMDDGIDNILKKINDELNGMDELTDVDDLDDLDEGRFNEDEFDEEGNAIPLDEIEEVMCDPLALLMYHNKYKLSVPIVNLVREWYEGGCKLSANLTDDDPDLEARCELMTLTFLEFVENTSTNKEIIKVVTNNKNQKIVCDDVGAMRKYEEKQKRTKEEGSKLMSDLFLVASYICESMESKVDNPEKQLEKSESYVILRDMIEQCIMSEMVENEKGDER